jgi:ABC-2 type transport system ATP-binding protein
VTPLTTPATGSVPVVGSRAAGTEVDRTRTGTPELDAHAVAVRGLHKSFGPVPALVDLDLSAPQGRITVLLGPNGAGKTTAIRAITGALPPDAGTVRVFGLDPAVHGEAVRTRCGVVSAKPALYDRLSGMDNLRYSAELHGLGRGPSVDGRIRATAGRFGIDDALDAQVGGYSTGMKTRLALARSVLHRPDLLLYDEPTSGLDPESSQAVLELIRAMTADGTTVIMCTHLLLEAEGLADHVVVLQDGSSVVAGEPAALMARYWPDVVVRVSVEGGGDLPGLADLDGVLGCDRDGDAAVVHLDDLARVPDVVSAAAAAGARITRVVPHEPTLEDLYFAVRKGHGRSRLGPVSGSTV